MANEIIGIGGYAPPGTLTNLGIEAMRPEGVSKEDWTTPDWVIKRTGIEERRKAEDGVDSIALMIEGANDALKKAEKTIEDIKLIITVTSFEPYGFQCPRGSERFKHLIGARQSTLSLTENATCAGFCFGLDRAMVEMNRPDEDYDLVLVAAGDKITAGTNYYDRATCILFGDRAGAVVIKRTSNEGYGILATCRHTLTWDEEQNKTCFDLIRVPVGGSLEPSTPENIVERRHYMQFTKFGANQMFRLFKKAVPELCAEVCGKAGIDLKDVNLIVPHQANAIMLQAVVEDMRLRDGVMFTDNVRNYGNNSSSSIPAALNDCYRSGRLKRGDIFILVGVGGGLTLSAGIGRWSI